VGTGVIQIADTPDWNEKNSNPFLIEKEKIFSRV
jgi:hypothetical protein